MRLIFASALLLFPLHAQAAPSVPNDCWSGVIANNGRALQMRKLLMRCVQSAQLLVLLTFSWQTAALGQNRWVELKYDDITITYDLTTVQMRDPGRFTIISKSQDLPDVLRLRLAVLDTLKSYCGRPAGEYAPPRELFMLGLPDMPIENIKVETYPGSKPFKRAVWYLPYRRLTIGGTEEYPELFNCKGPYVESTDKEYDDARTLIMNGSTDEVLYDCRHGLFGFVEPTGKAITTTNITGAFLDAYLRLCPVIVGGLPYMPDNAPNR